MANHTIIMNKIRIIIRMHSEGRSKSFISHQSGVARNTVKKYLQRIESLRLRYDEVQKLSDKDLEQLVTSDKIEPSTRFRELEAYLPIADKALKRRGMTRTRLWRKYKEQHIDGFGFSQFCLYLSRFQNSSTAVMRMTHKAGDKMFVDYAGEKLSYVNVQTGQVHEVEVFAAILGASQLVYVEATHTQQKQDFIGSCERAMHYFGGVPQAIVPDNLKSAITKANRYEPTLNETFADFSEHYQTAILAARARAPQDKAHVENIVRILYRNIYVEMDEKVFTSIDEINRLLAKHLEVLNNTPMYKRPYSRRQQFEEIERHELKALPALRYEFKLQSVLTVSKNGHIFLGKDKHYYSVPYTLIGEKVKVLFCPSKVDIYHKLALVATHARSSRPYDYTTDAEHLASTHRYVEQWSIDKFIAEGAKISPAVALYVEHLIKSRQHPEQGYKACMGLFALARKVGHERFILACQRATEFNSYSYRTVMNILERGMENQTLYDDVDDTCLPEHENIRGQEYYN